MHKIYLALLLVFVMAMTAHTQRPRPATSIDEYMLTASTIIIAKCLEVGPVNILLRADVRVEVLYVVKGEEVRGEITVHSQYGMKVGHTYLLRTTNSYDPEDRRYFTTESRDSVIELAPYADIERLKTLSPRIVVLRTMNQRIDEIESRIRGLEHELEALKSARREKSP